MSDKMLEGAFYSYMCNEELAHPGWNRQVLEFYVQHFAGSQHVLDVGCGEGQFIELIGEQGGIASGVDCDTQMVTICQEKGLDVVEADLFDYLREQGGQFDGVFSSNVIEHLTAQDALRFFRLAYEALRPGGVLLVATPNPESLIVHLYEFWRDATHIRLYNRSLLEFLLSWAGFDHIESGENPRTHWDPSPELQAVPGLLENLAAWDRPSQPGIGTATEFVLEPQIPKRERTGWRRVAFPLRRRLAQFMVRTVMFEEFAEIEASLAEIVARINRLAVALSKLETASASSRRVSHTLYQSHSSLLTVPREVFAKGIKPSVEQDSE